MMELLFTSPFNVMYFNDEDKSRKCKKIDSTHKDTGKCVKLKVRENLAACNQKRELLKNIEQLDCNYNVPNNIGNNYLIVKQIISNLPWQDKLICKLVCKTWYSAVQILQREQLSPEDFVIDLCYTNETPGNGWFKQSGIFLNEPLAIFTFSNTGFHATSKCHCIDPKPCDQICNKHHCFIDLINNQYNAPKNCMLTVRAHHLVYNPLPNSVTYRHSINHDIILRTKLLISGLYIPKIPNVGFKVLNIDSQESLATSQKFFEDVKKLSEDHIIKGALVYVTENYILNSAHEIGLLRCLKEAQADIPFALGGCIVEDTMTDSTDIDLLIDVINEGKEYMSANCISIGLFTVPKNIGSNDCNFEMYSFIIDYSNWCKTLIQERVTEFSKRVPQFEYSVAIKFSCVGRGKRDKIEQDSFRKAFPNTKIVGCFGNGELGVNHPMKPGVPLLLPNTIKRIKTENRDRPREKDKALFEIVLSYSTVFVYIGWGKIISPNTSV